MRKWSGHYLVWGLVTPKRKLSPKSLAESCQDTWPRKTGETGEKISVCGFMYTAKFVLTCYGAVKSK